MISILKSQTTLQHKTSIIKIKVILTSMDQLVFLKVDMTTQKHLQGLQEIQAKVLRGLRTPTDQMLQINLPQKLQALSLKLQQSALKKCLLLTDLNKFRAFLSKLG